MSSRPPFSLEPFSLDDSPANVSRARARARLGKLTKFVDTHPERGKAVFHPVRIDPETGEIVRLDLEKSRKRGREVVQYDQDAADLERWMLKGWARRLLMKVEDRDKRVRVPWSEIVWLPDLEPVPRRCVRVRERFRVETLYQDGEAVQRRAARFRVCNCCRDKISRDTPPEVWYSDSTARATFHKVKVCGSVWTCPVCSRRINLQRQAQIRAAYDLFVTSAPEFSDLHSRKASRWGDAVMVTFTIRHGAGDDLADLLGKLKEADRIQQRTYAYKSLMGYTRTVKGRRVQVPSKLGYVGRISTTEMTHGLNGWHPHLHQLWFFDRRLTAAEIEDFRAALFKEWLTACGSVDLPLPLEFVEHQDRDGLTVRKAVGVDCRRALSAEEYLTKFGHDRSWGPEREMASQHIKGARKGGRTPFQLLYDYGQGDARAGELFADFAEATLGRHQVEFSHRLRKRLVELGLNEVLASDEELAAQLGQDSRLLGELTDADFEALCTLDRVHSPLQWLEPFGMVLHIAKREGFDAAIYWIRSLPSYRGPPS